MEPGNWVSGLGGAKPHHMVPTPTTMDHVERKSTNKTPSTGKLNYETNKSVSLDRWAKMWPTPTTDIGHERSKEYWENRAGKHQIDLQGSVKMWPTPRAQEAKHGAATEWELQTDHAGTRASLRVQVIKEIEQDDPKITGSLNPQWVAWLMGYPTEYLSCVPWATRSFRKSRKK